MKKHILKMSAKLDDLNTAPKTHWSIINRFLNKRKMPAISPVADANWYLILK